MPESPGTGVKSTPINFIQKQQVRSKTAANLGRGSNDDFGFEQALQYYTRDPNTLSVVSSETHPTGSPHQDHLHLQAISKHPLAKSPEVIAEHIDSRRKLGKKKRRSVRSSAYMRKILTEPGKRVEPQKKDIEV